MLSDYNHSGAVRRIVSAILGVTFLFLVTSARAQLLTLGDVGANVNILTTWVEGQSTDLAALNVDVDALTTQTATNTADIATLTYDLTVMNAQIAVNGNVVTALDGRVGTIEASLPMIAGRVTILETANMAQVAATAANATVGTSNTAAIVANALRDDAHDVSIAANTSGLAINTAAIASLDGRVTAHDAVLAQHGTGIATATQTAVAAQTATATLRSDVEAGRVGLVQQDATGLITVGAQTGGDVVTFAGTTGNRRLSGVAVGVASSDAATVGQVAQGQAQTLAQANAYTDQRITDYVGTVDGRAEALIAQNNKTLRREMNAAAASTAAISSLPHSINPGEGMGAVAVGGRGSSVALAIGVSKAFKVDHTPVVRAGAALDAQTGTLTYNAAVGVHF